MTQVRFDVTNFCELVKALGRWDNEGGSLGAAPWLDASLSEDEVHIQIGGAAVTTGIQSA
jgi:hypothetical protein